MTQHHPGSMMQATGTRPDALPQAALRLAQACLPDADHPRRAPLPLLPWARALTLQASAGQLAARQASQWIGLGAALPLLALDAQTTQQGLAMAKAAVTDWLSWQAQWLDGLNELGTQLSEVRQANTVSKLADQELDVVQQAFALAGAQASAAMRLAENQQTSLAWWLQQRAEAVSGARG